MVAILLKSWAMGLLLTLFVDGLRLFGNHILAAPSLLLVPPFFIAGWVTNKGRWGYFEDTELYFLTILLGSLLYGLIALLNGSTPDSEERRSDRHPIMALWQ